MAAEQNLQVVRDAYAAFSRGDIENVLARLTDDVTWELLGASQVPYAGAYHGKSGVMQFFQRLAESDDIQNFEPRRFFADGDMVVVLGHYAARVKQTGRLAETDWVHAFTFRGDKVAAWREYFDAETYAKAYEPAAVATG